MGSDSSFPLGLDGRDLDGIYLVGNAVWLLGHQFLTRSNKPIRGRTRRLSYWNCITAMAICWAVTLATPPWLSILFSPKRQSLSTSLLTVPLLSREKKIAEQVSYMLHESIIKPALNTWAAPVVIVNRSDHDPWFCVDFCSLNHEAMKDSHLLPWVDESLDFLSKGEFLITLHLAWSYWQAALADKSKLNMAFVWHLDLFVFKVLRRPWCSPRTH